MHGVDHCNGIVRNVKKSRIMLKTKIEGLGTELFEDLIEEIVQESGAKHLEFELWDAADRSKIIFEELGIDLTDGEWQYDC